MANLEILFFVSIENRALSEWEPQSRKRTLWGWGADGSAGSLYIFQVLLVERFPLIILNSSLWVLNGHTCEQVMTASPQLNSLWACIRRQIFTPHKGKQDKRATQMVQELWGIRAAWSSGRVSVMSDSAGEKYVVKNKQMKAEREELPKPGGRQEQRGWMQSIQWVNIA